MLPVAIVTAAGFPRIERDFLEHLHDSPHIGRLYIFPNSAAECLRYKEGEWKPEYDLSLSDEERRRISKAMETMMNDASIFQGNPSYPALIIDRGAQVAFAALGLDAPQSEKQAWDPDQSKRKQMKNYLERLAPGFEILIGGMTTIDVTKKGVNKSHGVEWLSRHLELPTSDMLYVGDALYPGGNDAVVIETGIPTRAVQNPSETLRVIDELLSPPV